MTATCRVRQDERVHQSFILAAQICDCTSDAFVQLVAGRIPEEADNACTNEGQDETNKKQPRVLTPRQIVAA